MGHENAIGKRATNLVSLAPVLDWPLEQNRLEERRCELIENEKNNASSRSNA